MEFRVLGPVEVGDGGSATTPTRDKERRLLALLLAHANEVVSADRAAAALWPGERRPADARRAVQTHVSRLRAALGREGDRVVTRPPGYLLRVEPGELDAERFAGLVGAARRRTAGDPGEALALLDRALGLWRGPPYGELRDEEFAAGDAVRLEELRLVAVEERIDARLALGHHEAEVGELEALCAEHPLRERMRGQLMLALYRSGRQADALRAFEQHRRTMAAELGLDPSPELRDLEARILDHDPGLALRAPGPVTPPAVAAPVTSFVGRAGDVADVLAALGSARLLTLVGPGGVGKTRLALQVAATAGTRHVDGVAVCELAGVADPDAVAPAVATALRIQPRRDRSVAASVAEVLRTRRMLLVVDNCEHVVDAAAALLGALVASCPHVTLLATSRERLGVAGEQVWPVAPLEPDAAVELFCDRARAVRPDLDCSGEALRHIRDTCVRLDGLPLAIELAAAQVAAMNPADLVDRLDDRFRLLDRGVRSGPGRHRSLRAVVDWSYGRLGEPQRRLFPRLSVFAGGFTLDAAEAVCAGDGVDPADVPSLLADLVDASLVGLTAGGGPARYRLLETLRAYGRTRLAQDEAGDRLRGRHLDFHVALARRADAGLCGPDERRWVRRLDAGLDDLRAAHRWAVASHDADRALVMSAALHGYAYRTMRYEVCAWAEVASRLAGGAGHPALPLALGSAATGALGRGDLAAARALAGRAIEAAGDAPTSHLAFVALATAALFSGNLVAAVAHSRRATELADAVGDGYQSVVDRVTGTLALAYGGETGTAIEQAEETLAVARRTECPSAVAWGLYALGETLLDHDPGRALALLDESRALAEAGNTFLVGVAGTSATTLRARHGDAAEALRSFPDLIDLWDRVGNRTQLWTMLRSLVTTLVRLGRDEPAAVLYGALHARPTAPPLFGADAERLAEALATLEARAGGDRVAAWVGRGSGLRDDEVVDLARAAGSGAGDRGP
ncbi:MAG TPA: BTAD domain-containing putative transcriptional regulator [Acidimicrobiales bacterium]